MKKLICLLTILFLINIKFYGQNAIYISIQPADFGFGVREDHQFKGIGIYSSITYGNWGLYGQNHFNNHVKLSIGMMIPIFTQDIININEGYKFFFTTAINYHYLSSVKIEDIFVNPKIFNLWSFELGITYTLKRFSIGCRTDILRWEPCVDFGIPFKFKRYDTKRQKDH